MLIRRPVTCEFLILVGLNVRTYICRQIVQECDHVQKLYQVVEYSYLSEFQQNSESK